MKIIKKYWSIILLFCIWLFFTAPYFLAGKVIFPSAYLINFFAPWNAYPDFITPVKNNAMPDIISQIYPWKNLVIDFWRSGIIPLWNPYSFSGTPLLANYQSAAFSPFNLLFLILPFIDAWNILILLQPLLAGFFMYILARSFNLRKISSLIAAVSFMFCGFITTWMAYGTLGYAILYLPLILYAVEMYFKSSSKKFLFLLSFSIPLSFFSGHFQISLYVLITLFVYIIYKFFSTKNKRNTLYVILYTIFGLLIAMPQILPSIELYGQTVRSGMFQKIEAIPFQYFATFFAPDYFGNPVTRNDWFGHYAEWAGYIGILPLMLAVYSITRKKNVQTVYLFIFGILVLLLAFNSPLLSLLVTLHIPVLSTSAASRIIVIYSFFFSLLSAFGADYLIEDISTNKSKNRILTWLLSFFAAFIVLWLIVIFKIFLPFDKVVIAKQNLIFPSLIFILIFVSIGVSMLFQKRKFLKFLPLILLLILTFDMLRFTTKWQPNDPREFVFPEITFTKQFKLISGYDRVFSSLGGEAILNYYKLPSLEGYDPLYLKRYGEFISAVDDGTLKDPQRSVVNFPKRGIYINKAINLLGVKYLIHKFSDGRNSWTFPFWEYPSQFVLVYKDQAFEIYRNNRAFPRAFLVNSYEVIPDQSKIIKTLFSQGFNMKEKIILEKNPGVVKSKNNQNNKLEIVKYSPNEINIKTEVEKDSLLFLSDSYYDAWKAFQDGKEIPIYRANYAFRAVPVNAGSHVIEFSYDPLSFKIGLFLALIGFGGILVLLIPKH